MDRVFEKRVRKLVAKAGWNVEPERFAKFRIQKEIFVFRVLLGPDLFDLSFPVVESIYATAVQAIRNAYDEWANILVVVRDRDTMRFYERPNFARVAFLHVDDLAWLDGISIARLGVPAAAGSTWGESFIRTNGPLCLRLSRLAAAAGNPARAAFWGKAVASGTGPATA